jgi:hypothetical protein
MPGNLEEEAAVPTLVEEPARSRSLNRETAKNKRTGSITQILAARLPIQADQPDGFGLAEALCGDQQLRSVLA